MSRVIRWIPFLGFVSLVLGATVWQNGGADLFQRLTGEVPWDFREEAAAEAIDALVARVSPELETEGDPFCNVVRGAYVGWMIGPEAVEMLGPHYQVSGRNGGYIFTNLSRPERRPVKLGGKGSHGSRYASRAESVVIIRAEPYETKLYPYVDSTDRPDYLGSAVAESEQRATSYRLIAWVVEIASGRVTARTAVTPEPLPESFWIRDEDWQVREVEGAREKVIHRRINPTGDTFPKLAAWLEKHHEPAGDD
jgi:hypothetical protein